MTSTQYVRVEGSSYQRGRQYGRQAATIASVLMDLTARRIWLAAGNPCQVPFEQLDIAL
jgi:hypothetical protein